MTDALSLTTHDPDPQFAAHLEWQLRTALRRESRFAEPVATVLWRVWKLVAVFSVATTLGASGVLAAQEFRRSRAAELLVMQYEVRFEIARLREEAAREGVGELMRANEQGLTTPQAIYSAEEDRIALAQEASLLGLDAIEVGYTGREPDRRLSAPRVASRDLVSERIEQELQALRFRKSAAGKRVEHLEALHEKGFAGDGELARARLLDQQLADAIATAEHKQELRGRFLRGELAAGRVDLLGLREEALARCEQAQRELDLATATAQQTGALAAAGVATDRERRAALHDVATHEAQIRLSKLELETIEARLAELP